MRVAIIGAGWAGCAAAATLVRLGHSVTVFEAASVPGGRARRVMRDGLPLDNGQHLLLGAYEQVRNLLAVVHGGDGEHGRLTRRPLAVVPPATLGHAFALRAPARGPGALALGVALLRACGLPFADRLGAAAWFTRLRLRGFCCAQGTTVAQLCASGPRSAAEALWYPLCIAALNTPPERACAQVFANVLRAAFAGPRAASDFLLAATDLTALFPEAAMRFVNEHGGNVRLRCAASVASVGETTVGIRHTTGEDSFDAAMVAVGPHQLDQVLGGQAAFEAACASARALSYEPIATAWLGYPAVTALPSPIVRLDDAPGQWLFDRPDVLARAEASSARPSIAQMFAVVVSTSGPHDAMSAPELAIACDAQLRRLLPGMPTLVWSQAIVERRATYACTPSRPQAPTRLPHPRVALAGDWLDGELPATLEAAVRSGVAAAFALDTSTPESAATTAP